MVGHGNGAIEVAKTVLEVADVAWTAIECCHNHEQHQKDQEAIENHNNSSSDQELELFRSENRRLRSLLDQNLQLLQSLSQPSPTSNDCPPDLYPRLLDTVGSEKFLTKLRSLQQESVDGTAYGFPFKEATDADLHTSELLINVDLQEPSWWVWVTDEMCPSNTEERSGIDDENYLIITEEHVVDGVANFMARCILTNPKAQNLKPEDLQKILEKAFEGMNKLDKMLHIWHAGKMFYTLSSWGLALAGLYQSRGILKLAAKGIHSTSKVVLNAL